MLGFTIAVVSGCIVSMDSIKASYDESFDRYNIEDGYFDTQNQLNRLQTAAIEDEGVTLYQNYYREFSLDNDTVLRVFADRSEVDLADLWEGSLPQEKTQIAIDRTYAANNNLKPGDTISSGNRTWTIVGLISLPDYSALFRTNNDSMFDAIDFGVAVVNQDEFDAYDADTLVWTYNKDPKNESQENQWADDLLDVLVEEVDVENFVPQYTNQAIHFTGDDLGGDRIMMTVLLYIVVTILAFVFVVSISNTIMKEAPVIGTLRATGFTKGELVRHYMIVPLLVTIFAGIWGNILGYTLIKDWCSALEYNSYSLVEYTTRWNSEAFLETTLVVQLVIALMV